MTPNFQGNCNFDFIFGDIPLLLLSVSLPSYSVSINNKFVQIILFSFYIRLLDMNIKHADFDLIMFL